MTVYRWMVVASWWERLVFGAGIVAALIAFIAWLVFPTFTTTSGWPWKVLAVTALGLAFAGAQEFAARPAVRTSVNHCSN